MTPRFTLDDFRHYLRTSQARGFSDLLGRLPATPDSTEGLTQVLSILDALTPAERADPSVLDPNRLHQVGDGCGMTAAEVQRVLSGLYQAVEAIERSSRVTTWERVQTVFTRALFPRLPPPR